MTTQSAEHLSEKFRAIHEAQERLKSLRIDYEVTQAASLTGRASANAASQLSRDRYARAIGEFFTRT